MRGLEELQAAELDERDVAPRQFELERRAVMRGAKQHRLALEREAAFALREHLVGHPARLRRLVVDRRPAAAVRDARVSVHRFFAKRSAASAMTAFDASRIGCVER